MDFGKLAKLGKVVEKISEPAKTPVIPMPNRWFLEPDKFPHMQPLVEKVLAANQMQRPDFFSGAFVDPRTGKVLDFGVMNDVGVAIDPKTNRPKMSGVESGLQSFNEVPATAGPSTKSNLVRKGLFKRTGGDPLLDQINFLATIERSGAGHQYGLATEYATPAELLNTMTGANPTLRPHSRGDLFGIGDVIGQIVTPQGAPKDVYESLLVAPKGSDVQGVKLHKAQGGAVHMKDGTDEAIRKILEESKRETGKITRYEPRQSSKISAEERAQWDQRAKEQAARETAVKRGLQSWGTDIPGTIADLAVDLPYNLAQRAAGRRGDNIKPLGAGEAVRSGLSSALGWTQPQAETGMQPQNDWLNDAITNILQAANPVALTAAGDPVAAARLGKKGAAAVGKGLSKAVENAAKVDPYFSGSLGSQRGAINIGGWARSAKRSAEEAQRLFDIAKGTRAKSAQEAAGLYHPIGGGIKLSKPIELMEFETVKDPTVKGVKRRIITPEKMQGGIGIPLVGDRAAGGKLLTSLEGTQFSEPLTLEAGPDYMLTHTIRNSPESSIWRSGKGIISGLQKQVEMVRDMGRPIYGVNMVGSPTMVNYNTMVAEAILNQYNPAALTKKAKKEFLKDIRNYAPDADKPHLKPGAVLTEADMNDVEALRAKMLAEGAGPLRKAFVERMELEPFQNMGFPDVSASRLATTEPLLVDVPTGSAGFTIGTIDPAARALAQTPRGHKTYPIALGGEYFGSLESPVDYRNIFQEFADKRRLFGKPEGSDWRSFSLAPQFQTFDQEWLDRYMKSMGASNPREWKKGGVVQKAKGGAVKKAARKAGGGAAKQSGKITAALKQENLDAMRLAVMDKKLRKHHA